MKLKAVMISFALFIMSACATTPEQKLDTLIIQNMTNVPVFDAALRIPETGGIVSCSTILSGADCSVGFSERANDNNQTVLSWKQNERKYQKPLVVTKETKSHPDYPHKIVVAIINSGQLDVYLD